nr:protein 2B [Enterovirus F]
GLTDNVQSLGNAFGAGFTDEISNYVGQVRDMMVGSDTVVERVVGNIIKLLSALVIVVRNRSDIITVTATLSLLGCSGSPWRWLKSKICSILGINMAQKQ